LAADIARTGLRTPHIVHLPGNYCHAGPTSGSSTSHSPADAVRAVNQSPAYLPNSQVGRGHGFTF